MDIAYVRGEDNRGEGYSRQRLLEMIDTPYAAWMDSDDKAEPSSSSGTVEKAEKAGNNPGKDKQSDKNEGGSKSEAKEDIPSEKTAVIKH